MMLTKERLEIEQLAQKEARAAVEARTPEKRLAAVKRMERLFRLAEMKRWLSSTEKQHI
jgi:hypothetical protein